MLDETDDPYNGFEYIKYTVYFTPNFPTIFDFSVALLHGRTQLDDLQDLNVATGANSLILPCLSFCRFYTRAVSLPYKTLISPSRNKFFLLRCLVKHWLSRFLPMRIVGWFWSAMTKTSLLQAIRDQRSYFRKWMSGTNT